MARKDEPEAFLFDVDAFESDNVVEAMTTEQVGAYIRLLCKAWREKPPGTIPDDDDILARWTRLPAKKWIANRDRVLAAFRFSDDDGRWHQKRMQQTYIELLEKHEQRSRSGKAGATKRWRNHSHAISSANGKRDGDSIADGMAKNSNQKSKVKDNSNSQTKVPSTQAVQFDQKEFGREDWEREAAEIARTLGPTTEDRRLLAQLAWLVCAGAPVTPEIRDAAEAVKALTDVGKRPNNPVAYLRACLDESLGVDYAKALLKLAPSRAKCAGVMEGV